MGEYKDISLLRKLITVYKRTAELSPNGEYRTGYLCALSAIEGLIEGLLAIDITPKNETAKEIFDEVMAEARAIAEHYERLANKADGYLQTDYKGIQKGALLVLYKITELSLKRKDNKQ